MLSLQSWEEGSHWEIKTGWTCSPCQHLPRHLGVLQLEGTDPPSLLCVGGRGLWLVPCVAGIRCSPPASHFAVPADGVGLRSFPAQTGLGLPAG